MRPRAPWLVDWYTPGIRTEPPSSTGTVKSAGRLNASLYAVVRSSFAHLRNPIGDVHGCRSNHVGSRESWDSRSGVEPEVLVKLAGAAVGDGRTRKHREVIGGSHGEGRNDGGAGLTAEHDERTRNGCDSGNGRNGQPAYRTQAGGTRSRGGRSVEAASHDDLLVNVPVR